MPLKTVLRQGFDRRGKQRQDDRWGSNLGRIVGSLAGGRRGTARHEGGVSSQTRSDPASEGATWFRS
jgi:hypothetical protein